MTLLIKKITAQCYQPVNMYVYKCCDRLTDFVIFLAFIHALPLGNNIFFVTSDKNLE